MAESVASSSDPPDHRPHRPNSSRFKPTQPLADRIVRAVRHRLLLLHRSESNFFVLGATGNVYTVTLSSVPTCTCPDRTSPCKHILFVFIRVLGVSIDDSCIRRRSLRPCQLNRLLTTSSSPEALASAGLRGRFHELFFPANKRVVSRSSDHEVNVGEGDRCPICLEEMEGGNGKRVLACTTCRNPVHEECLMRWKRSRGRRSAICAICRARWREREQDKYVNLAAYVTEDDRGEDDGVSLCGD